MNDRLELPPLRELGPDLLTVTHRRRLLTLAFPFLFCAAYFVLAEAGWWPFAFVALVALSFVTYASTSHDLVHRTLGLSRTANDILLCLIELLAMRSGHAYQAAHLHHHARYPHPDDIEAAAARRSWLGALAEGFVFQFRIWFWAVRNAKQARAWVVGEGAACVALAVLAAALASGDDLPAGLCGVDGHGELGHFPGNLVGPARPAKRGQLFQTRAFRAGRLGGRVGSSVSPGTPSLPCRPAPPLAETGAAAGPVLQDGGRPARPVLVLKGVSAS